MKEDQEVIAEFNEYVNVTASELDKWLKSDDSSKAGWHKDGGDGESVGQESGHKIVEILKANPDKDPEKYTDDQIQHMRKVASYCKRHLAQESKGLKSKDVEEAKKTKSYISLMNWGHDPLKAFEKEGTNHEKEGNKSDTGKRKTEVEEDEEDKEDEEDEEDDEADEGDKKAGDKRKSSAQQNSANKKRETRQSISSSKEHGEDTKEGRDGGGDQEDDDYEESDSDDESVDKSSSKAGPNKGDTVSWNWGSGHPHGVVLDVKEGDATITTKRGNKVSRKGNPDDPAVILDAGKSKAIKLAHELN
ncbi:hypothetical protein VSDG_09103 [Cytospora chrysosperma]|uniref:Hypervirulence associated protein TUDOR domain-containing protein n=1 Tax=Cytospora chrysosperma TaxID=252740 RepID=A0A423VE80_CYTCH|nr:hypothetical protein VSDG_09103 [Valsa sordida]